MFDSARGPHFFSFFGALARTLRQLALMAVLGLAVATPALAQANNPSGLKLPRFVTTRSTPINVRVGPGVKYEVAWIYLKAGVPVEIVQEFDTWRKIRDIDGEEGWVHQNLLAGNRAAYVTPIQANGQVVLHAARAEDSASRAMLGAGLRVTLKQCDGTWCEVTATQQAEGERATSYTGFLHQEELWGAYPDEVFDD